MKHLYALCAAAFCIAPAMARDMVAHQNGDIIRLADKACAIESVLRRFDPAQHALFRSASAVVQGQTYLACWRVTPAGAHLLYEDGDEGVVPFRILRPQLNV